MQPNGHHHLQAAQACDATTANSTAPDDDVLAFEDAPSGRYTVKHPVTGAPTGLVFELAGPEHPERKRLLFDRQRQARAQFKATGDPAVSTPEEDDAAELELVLVSVLGWSGSRVTYTRAAAEQLLTDPKKRWLRDQLSVAIRKRESFIARSASA